MMILCLVCQGEPAWNEIESAESDVHTVNSRWLKTGCRALPASSLAVPWRGASARRDEPKSGNPSLAFVIPSRRLFELTTMLHDYVREDGMGTTVEMEGKESGNPF